MMYDLARVKLLFAIALTLQARSHSALISPSSIQTNSSAMTLWAVL